MSTKIREWTNEEILKELYTENMYIDDEGGKFKTTSIKNLKRVISDPRFPASKSALAAEYLNKILWQNKAENNFKKLTLKN